MSSWSSSLDPSLLASILAPEPAGCKNALYACAAGGGIGKGAAELERLGLAEQVSEAEPEGGAARPFGGMEITMTQEQKIIRAKVGLLELARQLGNVSQACEVGAAVGQHTR